jgi:CubicO group peptidase (beta-lactamase class C family)
MSGGLSVARLARLHDVMAGYVQRGEGPFRIASMTKPITAVAASAPPGAPIRAKTWSASC